MNIPQFDHPTAFFFEDTTGTKRFGSEAFLIASEYYCRCWDKIVLSKTCEQDQWVLYSSDGTAYWKDKYTVCGNIFYLKATGWLPFRSRDGTIFR